MRVLSFYPPTTEKEVAEKLNIDVKEVKKLKNNGILDYSGNLICNLSLDEYIRGGCGYDDTLSINLQNKIDEMIIHHYKDVLLRKKISSQLIKLNEKNFLKIIYKSSPMRKPSNIYAIEKIEWTDKAIEHSKFVFSTIKTELMDKVAYKSYSSYFGERYHEKALGIASRIRQFGFVGFLNNLIDNHLKKLESDEKQILDEFGTFDDEMKLNIKTISELKNNLDNADFCISNEIMLAFYINKKPEWECELSILKSENSYSECSSFADKLNISNEIRLWRIFRRYINKVNGSGYSDFVYEFNNRKDSVENHFLSTSDVLAVLNETNSMHGKPKIDDVETAIDEMKNKLNWNYNF